jgi:hypothetical protein
LTVEAKTHVLVLPYKGRNLPPSLAAFIQQGDHKIIGNLREAVRYCDPLLADVNTCINLVDAINAPASLALNGRWRSRVPAMRSSATVLHHG